MAKKGSKAKGYLLVVLALVGLLLYLFVGRVEVNIEKDSFTVAGTLSAPVTINYSDIEDYELCDTIMSGNRSFGLSVRKTAIGKYSSPAFGAYTLFAYKDVNKFIVIRHTDGVLVFNLNGEAETVQCFEQIFTNISKPQSADPSKEVQQQ